MNYNHFNTVRNDLVRKRLVPEYSKSVLFDPNSFRNNINDYLMGGIKEYVCPKCQISIKAPKQWMMEHIKTHKLTQEKRENETRWHKVRVY